MQAPEEIDSSSSVVQRSSHRTRGWLVTAVIIGIAAALFIGLWLNLSKGTVKETAEESTSSNAIEVDSSSLNLRLVTVGTEAPASTFSVAGSVEPNQQQLQQITPLVSGRVENIYVALGDYVKAGALLVRIDSPEVAELHGKLHEAETKLQLAKSTLNRVQQAANRVSVLKAKASLDEAESNLKRTKQLVSEGLTARKDLVATQSEYDRAKAEYNFQRDITLNKEVSEAKAAVTTAVTETEHIRDGLKALDAHLGGDNEGTEHDISKIELRAPISGTVIERFVNPGAGFDQGKPLLTIANTARLWVIANVPEGQMASIHIGSPASVKLGDRTVIGKVSYVDPRLNEDTRTSRVRIEIANPNQQIQVGSFAQVSFESSTISGKMFIPDTCIQTVEGKPVVFVYDKKTGKYSMRAVQVGPAASGIIPVFSGLQVGEQIAASGSFILKSKLLKEQFGDDD